MLNKLIVAVDSSEASDRAVTAARDLVKATGGSLHLVHVIEHVGVPSGRFAGGYDTEEHGDAEEFLAKELAHVREAGVEATASLVRARAGHAAQAIVETAEAEDADAIVMGSRGRGGLSAALLGSTSFKVLHLSDRPVLVVP